MKNIIRWWLPIITLAAGVAIQFTDTTGSSIAVARSGCLLALYGVLIEAPMVLIAVDRTAYLYADNLIIDPNPKEFSFNEQLLSFMQHPGMIWLSIGTVLWGFGDLL